MRTLYLSDLDGTLLRSDQTISAFTARTINELVKRGMFFSYATARSYITASRVTAGMNAHIPLVLYNGAFILDSTRRRCCSPISSSRARPKNCLTACGVGKSGRLSIRCREGRSVSVICWGR